MEREPMSIIRFADIYNEIHGSDSVSFFGALPVLDKDCHPVFEFTSDGYRVSDGSVVFLGHVGGGVYFWPHPRTPSEKYARWRESKITDADPGRLAALRRCVVLRWTKELTFICKHGDPRALYRAMVKEWGLRGCRGGIEWAYRLGTKIPLPLKKAIKTLEKTERRKNGLAS
jgi:hypothetical protein